MAFKFDSRRFDVFTENTVGETARKARMAAAAQQILDRTLDRNARVLGRRPAYQQFVDGVEGAAFEAIKPGGTIVFRFQFGTGIAQAIIALLRISSPYDPTPDGLPHYRDRHFVIIDDTVIDPPYDEVGEFDRMLIINDRIYANFLEAKYSIYESLVFPQARRLFRKGFDLDLVRDEYFGYRNLGILIRPK